VDVVGCDFDGCGLEVKEYIAEVFGDVVLDDPFAGFLGEVLCHFYVDVVRGDGVFAGPALLDDFDDLL
jgi:hypothetical protein